MNILSESSKKKIKSFYDWVNANSDDIPEKIVYPEKHDDHGHGHGHGHEEHHESHEHLIEEIEEVVEKKENPQLSQPEKWYQFGALVGGALIVTILLITVALLPKFGSADAPAMNEVAKRYLESGLAETGAVNVVTGMILDYRAFDTLGESFVLFTATITVLFLLQQKEKETEEEELPGDINSEIRSLPAKIIAGITLPFIFLYGIYIVLNGHLSPGGGFSGGAIIGGGLVLNHLVFGQKASNKIITVNRASKIMTAGLLVYICLKTYSILTGANGIHSIVPLGTPGSILSSGLIFPLNICVGIVVACTVFSLYSLFTDWSS